MIVGLVITVGVTATLSALGLALFLALGGVDSAEARGGAIAWLAAAGAIATFIGGRFAAVDARAMTARDGAMHGFVLWAAWAGVCVVTATAIAMWSWSVGGFDARAATRSPELVQGLWGALLAHAAMLLAAIVGGMRGARAEARAIGLRGVYPPERWDEVDDPASFERKFLADS